MRRIDFKKEYAQLYAPTARQVTVVDVPPMNFAMVDGEGDPNTAAAYREALEALYSVSYTAKFGAKSEGIADFRVGPLEGLWWTDDMSRFSVDSKGGWKWTSLIMQPEVVTRKRFESAVVAAGKKNDLPALAKLRFERFHEGRAAQILHVGPFSAEGPTIERIHAFIRDRGSRPSGKHHEIYLSDFRKTAPDRRRTIIRQPFS